MGPKNLDVDIFIGNYEGERGTLKGEEYTVSLDIRDRDERAADLHTIYHCDARAVASLCMVLGASPPMKGQALHATGVRISLEWATVEISARSTRGW